jgi:hypothetical protein
MAPPDARCHSKRERNLFRYIQTDPLPAAGISERLWSIKDLVRVTNQHKAALLASSSGSG